VRDTNGGIELAMLRWGIIPSLSKEINSGPVLINARSETVAQKPAFRSAFKTRRCLIPADGFFERKAVGKKRQTYYFQVTILDGEEIVVRLEGIDVPEFG
jgi:putative SOS response-associated peptidase YedK